MIKDSRYVFHHLLEHAQASLKPKSYQLYLESCRKFLTAKYVSLDLKTQLLDLENEHLKLNEHNVLSIHGESVEQVECRLLVCLDVLNNSELSESDTQLIGATNSARKYLGLIVNWFVYRGHLIQAQIYLQKLVSTANNNNVKGLVIPTVIHHAKSYALISKDELNTYLDDNEHLLTKDDREELRIAINASPSDVRVLNFSIGNGTLSKAACKGKTIGTVILFSIPKTCLREERTTIEPDDKHIISFETINTFWEDPIFRILSGWNIGGISWAFYCDVDPAVESKYTHVRLGIKEFYHPDIMLTDKAHDPIDFAEESALMGRDYYPHKDYVIKFLRDNFDSFKHLLGISKRDITANLFSNLIIQYNDASNGRTLYQKVIASTTPDSHSNSITKYAERCAQANVDDSLLSINTLLSDTPITSNASLQKVVVKFIETFVKHNIELNGGHIYCWDRDGKSLSPKIEPRLQPYIFSHLLSHFEFAGMQIVRESYAADGALDFLVSYNNEKQQKFTVCIELKLAHSGNIEHGLTKQLPEYMKGMWSKYGIYLYMWFKGPDFDQPKNYDNRDELQSDLESKNKDPRIQVIGIDCTKPPTPSKL